MKKKIIIILSVLICVALIAVIIPLSLPEKTTQIIQKLDYNDDVNLTYNPDQGFYKSEVFFVTPEGITYDNNKSFNEFNFGKYENQIFHLRMDISAFSQKNNGDKDLILTDNALSDLEGLLTNLKNIEKNAVIRFCYDPNFDGAENREPSLEIMQTHIQQLSTILNKFQTTLTAIEAGMIGRWGEMNGSDITKDPVIVNAILDAWLDNIENLPILTRQPKHIYDYFNKTFEEIQSFTIPKEHKAYRLGIFDDSYLGSESDLGTFRVDREKEIEWISKQTNHLPFGGEASYSNAEEALHYMEKGCIENMFKLHLSYLNYHYKNEITDYWKEQIYSEQFGQDSIYYNQSVYDYIAKHMGYRFVLKKSKFEYKKSLKDFKIVLNLENLGFGNLTKTKDLQLIVLNDDNEQVLRKSVGKFSGNDKIELKLDLHSLKNGNYKFYLSICSIEDGKPTYPIAFSNKDIFSKELKANYIGKIEIK